MKKIHFALCSILLLASCGGGSSEDTGKNYIADFKKAYDASYSSGAYSFTSKNGMKLGAGIKNLNGTYYHLSGSGLTFQADAKGVKGSEASSLKGQLLLTGGSLSLTTNASTLSKFSDFTTLSPVKAKAYFDGDALYFNASGENKSSETNSTVGALVQTVIREASGNTSYVLYGGGDIFQTANRYKGKWTLGDEDKQKISDKMPLVKEGDTLSEHFSLSSFLEGAYEDGSGKTAFAFETKDDGTKRIKFETKDETVLTAAMSAGFATFRTTLDTSESVPTQEEVDNEIEKFFRYADIKTFSVTTLFKDSGLNQVTYDMNFILDETKIKETYPDAMFDFSENAPEGSEPNDYKFNLDESLSFSGTILCDFGDEDSFALPSDLSGYLEFPAISSKEGSGE